MTKNALLERGPKNSGMGRPPPIIRAMPKRKRFFSIDVFPYIDIYISTQIPPSSSIPTSRYHSWGWSSACFLPTLLAVGSKEKLSQVNFKPRVGWVKREQNSILLGSLICLLFNFLEVSWLIKWGTWLTAWMGWWPGGRLADLYPRRDQWYWTS